MTDLAELGARDGARRIAEGTLTAEALTRACLERIAAREPDVQAWQHLDPEAALAAARRADRDGPAGPLRGVPIAVKDVIDTADMPTTYGSALYRGHRPAADAAVVALARAAGAVVLGKTVSTEFAAMAPGRTRNPHAPGHTPGGSSSGSAAAVAAGMVPLAFGTQTAGSVIRPAAYCGVVGYKPSFGLMPTVGTKPLAESLDTIGAIARSVADAAFLAATLSGRLDIVPTEGSAAAAPRIGLYRTAQWAMAEPATVAALERAAAALARAGAVVVERAAFPAHDGMVAAQQAIMGYEMARNLAWERLNHLASLAPKTVDLLRQGLAVDARTYDAAQAEAAAGRAAVDALFEEHDALLVPAAPGEAPAGLEATGDPIFNRAWTLLHLPCITLPAGRGPSGLPVGIQLVGRRGEDARLLAVAGFAERALAAAAAGPGG